MIRLESAEVLGENELAAGEVRLWNDTAHGDDVARTGTDLLAIGQGNVLGQAKVDEVVLRGQRRNLTCNRDLLSVEGKAGLDDTGIEGQRCLRVFGTSRRSSGVRGSSLYGTISTTDIIREYATHSDGSIGDGGVSNGSVGDSSVGDSSVSDSSVSDRSVGGSSVGVRDSRRSVSLGDLDCFRLLDSLLQ